MELWQGAPAPARAACRLGCDRSSCGSTAGAAATCVFRTGGGRGLGWRPTRLHRCACRAAAARPRSGGRPRTASPRAMAGAGRGLSGDGVRAGASGHGRPGPRPRGRPRSAPWPADSVWDLYAGHRRDHRGARVGAGASVESVELDRRAVAEAERGARRRGATRAGWRTCSAELRRPDLVITNPPRTGMDARVTDALERVRPPPCRLRLLRPGHAGARSAAGCQASAWPDVAAFDLFPQTAHVETVAVLEPAS